MEISDDYPSVNSSHSQGSMGIKTSTSIYTNLMSAILLTSGPISTHKAFVECGPEWLRNVTKTPYLTAARRLENLNVVQLVRRGGIDVVVKKSPDEVQGFLARNQMCSLMEYSQMYEQPLPDAISPSLRRQMIVDGYLNE